MEGRQVRVGFQKSLLHGVLCIFPVSGDVPCQPEDFLFVAIYQFFKSKHVTSLRSTYQQVLVIANDRRWQEVCVGSIHDRFARLGRLA
jgi:hypothetical protein